MRHQKNFGHDVGFCLAPDTLSPMTYDLDPAMTHCPIHDDYFDALYRDAEMGETVYACGHTDTDHEANDENLQWLSLGSALVHVDAPNGLIGFCEMVERQVRNGRTYCKVRPIGTSAIWRIPVRYVEQGANVQSNTI